MFTKGYTLTEVLIALALTSMLFTGAWSAQWFVHRQQLLATEQLHAVALLRELHQLIAMAPSAQQYAAGCPDSCPLPDWFLVSYAARLRFFQQAGLTDLQICLNSQGMIVSWESTVQTEFSSTGCGDPRRQRVTVAW